MKRTLLPFAMLALLLAACSGGNGNQPPATSTPDPSESVSPDASPSDAANIGAADELVLRLENEGGFVPVEWIRTNMPVISIYVDGSVITHGPTTLEYPGSALPNLQTSQLSAEQLDDLLAAAAEAGLTDGDQVLEPSNMDIADATTTVLTVVADGTTSVTRAYALMIADGDPDPQRAALRDFIDGPLGELQMTESQPYEIDEMRVWVSPARGGEIDPELGSEMEWPLETPLASFGAPSSWGPSDEIELRCGTVSGEELDTLLTALEDANQLTMFTSRGDLFSVQFRPLLPDESGCPEAPSGS